jgi:hypothetical protein
MRLFKCYALMPNAGEGRSHLVSTYVVIANAWQEARARIQSQEPRAEFVTIPVEVPHPLMVDARLMSEREYGDLRSACEWNEDRFRKSAG